MYFPVYPKQAEFLDAPEFVKGFVAGQGAGKSKIGAYDLLCRAKPNRTYAIVTPTYPMLRDATFRTFREVGEQTGQWIPEAFNKTEFNARVRTRTNPSGTAEILFRSGHEPDRLRGPNLSGIWMDEASLLAHEAYQICIARLREANEQGWLTGTFTPKGRLHWTYRDVFGPGSDGKPRPGVFLVHAETKDNPFNDQGFVQRVYAEYAGLRAEQELGGKFVSIEGAEWPPEYFENIRFVDWPDTVIVEGNAQPALVIKGMALDPSKGRADKPGDYSAIVYGGLDRQGVLWVDAELSQTRDTTQQIERLAQLYDEHVPLGIGVETVQFQELLARDLVRMGRERGKPLPVYGIPNTVPKDVRIRSLTPYLSQHGLRIRKSAGGDLLALQLAEFPQADHDDGPDALEQLIRLLWHLLGRKSPHGEPEGAEG